MNRLLISLLLLLFMSIGVYGQSTFWSDRFSSPEGWSLQENWRISGGVLYFDWNPTIYNFDQTAVSPFITLDEFTDNLIITQNLQVYNPTENEVAQLIVMVGEEEFIIWEYSLDNGNWGNTSGSELIIPLQDFASETIQFHVRTYGETTFNWSWWQIFDMTITANYEYDLNISNFEGINVVETQQTADWIVEVSNHGSNSMDNYTVNLIDSKSGEIVDHIDETGTLAPGESKIFGLSWTPYAAYNTLIYAQVETAQDQFPGNNLSGGSFLRIEPNIDYNILVWNNDNGIQSIICPEYGDLITPNIGLVRALVDAGLEFDLYTYLPDNLEDWDIIISTMGNYCLS